MTCICGARVKYKDLSDHIEEYHGRWSELKVRQPFVRRPASYFCC